MLKPKDPQESFYGSYLYEKIAPVDHLLRKNTYMVIDSYLNNTALLQGEVESPPVST